MQKKPGVLHFVKEERKKGTSDDEIQHKLLDAGWHIDIIHHALDKNHGSRPKVNPAKSPVSPRFTTEQYVVAGAGIFLLLVLFVLFI